MTSLVQDITATAASGTTITATVSATAKDNTIIAMVTGNQTSIAVSSMGTTGGTAYTWTKATSLLSGTQDAEIWIGTGGSGATAVIATMNATITATSRIEAMEWTGNLNLDQVATTSGTSATYTSPTVTQKKGADLFIVCGRSASTASSGPTGAGWTVCASGLANASSYAYLISSDALSHSTTFTLAASAAYVSVGASFYETYPPALRNRVAVRRASFL